MYTKGITLKFWRFPYMKAEKVYAIINEQKGKVTETGGSGMYQIGDRVLYGIHGISIITDREERVVDRKRISYLVLNYIN